MSKHIDHNVILFPARPCPDPDDICDSIYLCSYHYNSAKEKQLQHDIIGEYSDSFWLSVEDDINFNNRD